MSIVIKGMHKPKSCEECPFRDYEQGFCFASEDEDGNFLLRTAGVGKNEIHPNCPIIEVPSAGQWIPCSERLPEVGEDVLISYDGNTYEAHLRESKEYFLRHKSQTLIAEWEVDAWCELPKPWKGEKDEID